MCFLTDTVGAMFASQYDIKPSVNAYVLAYGLRKEHFVLLCCLTLFFAIIGGNLLLPLADGHKFNHLLNGCLTQIKLMTMHCIKAFQVKMVQVSPIMIHYS